MFGNYTLEVSKDGYETVYIDIDIQENETSSIQEELTPTDEDGKEAPSNVPEADSNDDGENVPTDSDSNNISDEKEVIGNDETPPGINVPNSDDAPAILEMASWLTMQTLR